MKKYFQAFTLVELIVVITILAILGAISFVAFNGYTKNARDSTRIRDVNNIVKGVTLFDLQYGYYPEPSNSYSITYSGALAWEQGSFGDTTITLVQKIPKKPVDPLTGSDYAYSVTNIKEEFQVGTMYEGTSIQANIITQTYASKEKMRAFIKGNYNGKFLRVDTGSTLYVLGVPSIITSEINSVDVITILNNKTFVYNDFQNLPPTYKDTEYALTGGLDFTPGTGAVLYVGTMGELQTTQNKIELATNIKTFYEGTILWGKGNLGEVIDISPVINQTGSIQLITDYMRNNVGGLYITSTNNGEGGGIIPSCASPIPTTNVNTTTIGTPTIFNTSWQSINSENPCYVACNNGYDWNGVNCIHKYAICNASNVGEVFSALTTYPGCNTPDISVCNGIQTGYTISACNVGATIASTDRTISAGNYFQWGNNYPSSQGGPTTTTLPNASSANGYGPLNYYSSVAFILGTSVTYDWDWTTVINNNLWGNTTNTSIARKGPCASDYHVPANGEWSGIISAGGRCGGDGCSSTDLGTDMQNDLKLPFAGRREWDDGSFLSRGYWGYYWSTTPYFTDSRHLRIRSIFISPSANNHRAYGMSVRCFKN